MGGPAAICQPPAPRLRESRQPFVPGLPADPIAIAELSHPVEPLPVVGDEGGALVHRVRLQPRHQSVSRSGVDRDPVGDLMSAPEYLAFIQILPTPAELESQPGEVRRRNQYLGCGPSDAREPATWGDDPRESAMPALGPPRRSPPDADRKD